MNNPSPSTGRRNFLRSAAALTAGMAGLTSFRASAANYGGFAAINPVVPPPARSSGISGDNDHNIIGPKEGYSPQIGTLVSMLAWLRPPITNAVKGMTVEQLDFLLDAKANTIGALLYHLAAADAFYHEHTFHGVEWGKFDPAVMNKYGVAMNLGEAGRKEIKGNTVDFYLNLLQETRESTLAEFKKRDDKWLMTVDEKWFWGPTNNYCKWFHVAEHESHHYGQIALLKSRVPGAKPADSGG